MMIVAMVQGNLKRQHSIELHADKRYIAHIWGTAKVKYTLGHGLCSKYLLIINGGEAFLHVDAIERYDPQYPFPR